VVDPASAPNGSPIGGEEGDVPQNEWPQDGYNLTFAKPAASPPTGPTDRAATRLQLGQYSFYFGQCVGSAPRTFVVNLESRPTTPFSAAD